MMIVITICELHNMNCNISKRDYRVDDIMRGVSKEFNFNAKEVAILDRKT